MFNTFIALQFSTREKEIHQPNRCLRTYSETLRSRPKKQSSSLWRLRLLSKALTLLSPQSINILTNLVRLG